MNDRAKTNRFWWVNQNQTFEQEVGGGYMWSPKRRSDGTRNPFYEFMREVAPGDLVFSFRGAAIRALGVVQSLAYECPKPSEFGGAGPNWSRIGWRIDVRYVHMANQIRPADHMGVLAPFLPALYSPLLRDGRGLQSVYLTEVSNDLARALVSIIGQEARDLADHTLDYEREQLPTAGVGLAEWEEHLTEVIRQDDGIKETEKQALILARRGQGLFKQRVRALERSCRITHVDRLEHLRASHCKPWRDCSNAERLDGENGLLLTPSIDHLFDRGLISFEDSGDLLISPVAHRLSLARMGIVTDAPMNVGSFSEGQKRFLDYHRDAVFLEARR